MKHPRHKAKTIRMTLGFLILSQWKGTEQPSRVPPAFMRPEAASATDGAAVSELLYHGEKHRCGSLTFATPYLLSVHPRISKSWKSGWCWCRWWWRWVRTKKGCKEMRGDKATREPCTADPRWSAVSYRYRNVTVRRCRESRTGGITVGVVRAEAELCLWKRGFLCPARRFSKCLTLYSTQKLMSVQFQ